MYEADEIARFYDRCSDLMRELLDHLAEGPHRPRPFPEIEDAMGWPRRRLAAGLAGAGRMRLLGLEGRRPYRFRDERQAASGGWEKWMDARRAPAVPEAHSREYGRAHI